MKGLQWSLLQGILLTVLIVLIGMLLVGPVRGFDVTKYFGIQPILGKPGTINPGDFLSSPPTEVKTRCGLFEGWHWSQSPNIVGSPHDLGNGLIIDKFQSPACPTGYLPVACATYPEFGSLTTDDASKYGDDAIISIYNDTDNTCIVEAKSGNLDKTQARYVGVLCADLVPADVQYVWTDWITTQSTSNSCRAGFTSLSGMVQSDTQTTENARITVVYLNSTYAKFFDTSGNNIYNSARKFGMVCVNNNVLNDCGIHSYNTNNMANFKTWYDDRGTVGQGEYIAFGEQTCPGDSSLISCGGGFFNGEGGSTFMNEFYSYNLEQFDDPSKGAGLDKIQILPISTCQLQFSYSEYNFNTKSVASSIVCAENLWHWSDWQTSTNTYGDFSVSCPSGTEAVACASDTASLENGFDQSGGGSFGEDAISTINFTTDSANKRTGCFIESDDWHQPSDMFKRRVGALCILNSYSNDFVWKTNTFTSNNGNNVQPKITSDSCGAGYAPIFCTMQMDPTQVKYREDAITGIDIDLTAGTCSFTLVDPINPSEYQGTIGVLCAKNNPQVVEIPDYKSKNPILSSHANPFYNSSVSCSSGIATTALTVTDSGYQYTTDPLISMVPTSNLASFIVQPYDWVDNSIAPVSTGSGQSRKVGVACLDYPKEAFMPTTQAVSTCTGIGGGCLSNINCPAANGVHCNTNPFECSGATPCCCVPLSTPPSCGNGICESGETSSNCCTDCGCTSGTCQNNACVGSSQTCFNAVGGVCLTNINCPASNGVTCNSNPFECTGSTPCCCVPISGWSFSVATSPTTGTVAVGTPSSQTVQITVTKTGGTAQPVSLSTSGTVTSGIVTQPSPTSCTPNPTCTPAPTFTVSTAAGTPANTYPITVTGTSSGASQSSATYKLTVSTSTCIPSCAGKSCGPDGCGGSCGTCLSGICQGGTCVAMPTCAGIGGKCTIANGCTGSCNGVSYDCSGDPFGNTCCCTGFTSPPPVCGNHNCESSSGETQSNCCTDCGCSSGTCQNNACSSGFSLSLNPSSWSTFDNNPSFSLTVYITATAASGTPQQINFAVSDPVPGTTTTSPSPCTTSASSPYQCTSYFIISGNPSIVGTYSIIVTGSSATGGSQPATLSLTVSPIPHCAGTTPNKCNQFNFMGSGSCNLEQKGCTDPPAGPCLGTPAPCFGRGPGVDCTGLYGNSGCTWYSS